MSLLLFVAACKKETVRKVETLTPESARELAKEAYLFGLPVVLIEKQSDFSSYTTRVEKPKAPINQFYHYREFADASNKSIVGLNVDNLYSLASLDLTKEPLILSIPPMGNRFWLMQLVDAWNGVPAAPGSRTHGSKGGTFAIVGPDFKGQLPDGVEELRSPTNITMIGGRTYCSGKADYATVAKLQNQYKLVPLSQWGKNYVPSQNVPLKESVDGTTLVNKQVTTMSAEQFYKNLNRLMVGNPPYAPDADELKKLEPLGIKPGGDFSMSTFTPEIAKAIEEGYKDGFKALMAESKNLGEKKNGWGLTYDMGRYGTRYAYRAAWTFFGVGGNVLEDAFYPLGQEDAQGNALDSANKYTLTFKKDEIPPAKAFWSLTMYDMDSYLVDNKLNRYALGDRSGLKYNPDGSLTLYLQKDSPGKDKETNWLPTPQSGGFKVALRVYTPEERVINKSWIPPAIQKEK